MLLADFVRLHDNKLPAMTLSYEKHSTHCAAAHPPSGVEWMDIPRSVNSRIGDDDLTCNLALYEMDLRKSD